MCGATALETRRRRRRCGQRAEQAERAEWRRRQHRVNCERGAASGVTAGMRFVSSDSDGAWPSAASAPKTARTRMRDRLNTYKYARRRRRGDRRNDSLERDCSGYRRQECCPCDRVRRLAANKTCSADGLRRRRTRHR